MVEVAQNGAAGVIAAHPDDETLWAGGQILTRPDWDWFVLSVCRANDPDRAPRFRQVLRTLKAAGSMTDLDDGPDQTPLDPQVIESAVLSRWPDRPFDLIFTHAPFGEYTRHLRHEELSRAVIRLWQTGRITASCLMLFAYEDGDRQYLPRPRRDAHVQVPLPDDVWRRKYEIMTGTYGFTADSWEARTVPRTEAFYRFDSTKQLAEWLTQRGFDA